MTLSNNAVRLIELQRIRELARNLELIDDLAARMGKIVAHVKAFARNDAVEREPVSIGETIKQSLALVQAHRKANDVTIRVAHIPDEAIALASAIRAEQVFVNLLTNAIDACAMSEDRKEVVIEAAMTARTVRVSFRDSGPGIAPEALSRLFEPFYPTIHRGTGLGWGLEFSKPIVDYFGGRLRAANVEAEPGRRSGAVFVVELQRATVQSESIN
jgi:two-component system C4-dicarboxylate transport sensor histidine kinase DctB